MDKRTKQQAQSDKEAGLKTLPVHSAETTNAACVVSIKHWNNEVDSFDYKAAWERSHREWLQDQRKQLEDDPACIRRAFKMITYLNVEKHLDSLEAGK